MFKGAAKPKEPLPPETRQRALWQGALGVLAAPVGMVCGSWLLQALGSTSQLALLLVFLFGLAAVIYGVWRLGVARDGRWDARGVISLALMFVGYPLLFLFAGWCAMGLYVMITGQPLKLFGN